MPEFSPFTAPLARALASDLKEFFSISEGWYVEYKSLPIPPKALAKSMSSFANQYGGWLVLGAVENKQDLTVREFPGLSEHQVRDVVQALRDASRDSVNPEVYYEYRIFDGPIEEIDLPSGKSIVVVHIPQGPEPPYIHADARIYRRVGDSSAPKSEIDQSTLDRLSLRARQSRKRLEDMVTRLPLTSKGEEENCYLHLSITSDPYEIGGHWFGGTFDDFSDIMKKNPIPFDNIFTQAGGFVARQVGRNNPYNRVLTWEFDRHCHSFITLGINTIDSQGDILASYNTGLSFAALLDRDSPLSSRLLDLNEVFKASWAISTRHRELAAAADVYGPFYFKGYIENAWRRVPFLDMPSFLSHIGKFGIPVVQEDDVLIPPGTDLKSFQLLDPYYDYCGPTIDSKLEVSDALAISMNVFDALGIPREFFLQASQELVDISDLKYHGTPDRGMPA